MELLTLGEAIKRKREALGLSQEEVCEGICSVVTLSRVENGKQDINYYRAKNLLEKLGLPSERFYFLLSRDEAVLINTRKELSARCIQFEQAEDEKKQHAWALAMEHLQQLEQLAEKDDLITQQCILSHKATLGRENGPYSPEERLEILLEALHLTAPGFDPENLKLRRYSIDETRLINQIANTYSYAGERNKALQIYNLLYQYVEQNDRDLANYASHLALIAYNYARILGDSKWCDQAIEVAERGRQVSVKYGTYQFLPGFLAILAECHYLLGNMEQSKKFYLQAHYLYEVTGDQNSQTIIDADFKERFPSDFPT